ncbi:cytochrome P450 [Actinomadura sp. KC06]|uniref:cytochrome P450 n=1 Tax=Actinomadura sp. KC06 TaxID=2530369 RepID=UPI00105247CA|nr:cytochrome P450 [Actinomadura sp. KC06]TDD35513.1 cytochrome P450 [Actinomadura sp. KC06]
MSTTRQARGARRAGRARRLPPGTPFSATPRLLKQLVSDRLGMMTTAAGYGDAVRMVMGPRQLYFFNHPDHAKHVLADNAGNYHKGIGLAQARRALGDGLLTSEGDLWRMQRRAIQPAFQHKRIARQADAIIEESAKLVSRLRRHAGGPPVDVVREMTDLTLGVLGRTLLDTDLSAYSSIGKAFEAVQDQAMFEMVSQGMVPTWVPLPKQLRFRRARRELDEIVGRMVAERSARSAEGDDALSLLIVSTRAEADPAVGRRRMRDELVTLMLAGHETTASTLGWSFYLLDRHPEVMERLRDEVTRVLGDRTPVLDDLNALPFTNMVLQEVMRLYPPVWLLSRIAQADDEIGGYHVPAGSDVLISPYTIHRHPGLWKDPERFDPGRFDPDSPDTRPRYAHIPFGAGPRFCVGNHLGMMEATFVLAMVVRELGLAKVRSHTAVPEAMLSLRLRGGLPMHITER